MKLAQIVWDGQKAACFISKSSLKSYCAAPANSTSYSSQILIFHSGWYNYHPDYIYIICHHDYIILSLEILFSTSYIHNMDGIIMILWLLWWTNNSIMIIIMMVFISQLSFPPWQCQISRETLAYQRLAASSLAAWSQNSSNVDLISPSFEKTASMWCPSLVSWLILINYR